MKEDLDHFRAGNVKPTAGDIRCVTYGHLVRLAIWSLRLGWNKNKPTTSRITKVADWLQRFGGWAEVEKCMEYDRPACRAVRQPGAGRAATTKDMPLLAVHESVAEYGAEYAVSFL